MNYDDTELLSMLANLPPEGQQAALMEMLYPYDNEQGVLDKEMAMAQQLRQRGPERSSPLGAALGGLSNAVGNAGGTFLQTKGLKKQRDLGTRAQEDATHRFQRLFRAMTMPQSGAVEEMPGLDMPIPLS